MEQLSEAHGDARGGRSADGDSKVGPIRALARLAVMCGALKFKQAENEEFDVAVERARAWSARALASARACVPFPGRCPTTRRNSPVRSGGREEQGRLESREFVQRAQRLLVARGTA